MAARPRAALIYNPNAGRRRHGQTIEGILSALGAAYEISASPTRSPRDAITLGREAASRGDTAVFAWGGDGTIREVVEGILGSPTRLGVLPGGTFNVVALAIGLPRNPVEAARALVHALPSARDVGLIASTPFLMQATAGLDGFLMHQLRADLKARIGKAGVVIDGLRGFTKYRFEPFDVEVDGEPHRVTGAAFVNMTEYAGAYRYVPGARWDDGIAHVVLFKGRSHMQALMFALGIALGRHHLRRDVLIKEARRMTIGAQEGLHLQTDGDPWKGPLPATCELSPQRIQALIPPGE
jgi:diacylglycerol kinase (ATP)